MSHWIQKDVLKNTTMIQFQVIKDHIVIAGDTYPVKDQIKEIGGRFDWQEKYWKLPHTEENLQKVEQLCRQSQGADAKTGSSVEPSTEGSIEPPEGVYSEQTAPPSQSLAASTHQETSSSRPAGRDTYTISQIADLVSKAVERAMPNYVWVTGEIQNLSRKPSSRGTAIYLSLAEPKENSARGGSYSLQAAVWSDRYAALQKKHGADATAAVFQEGLQVRMRCKVSIYKDRGQVSLQISDIDPAFTQGALALARQKTLAELRRLGLEKKQQRLSFDPWSKAIGLITAEKSRAYGDFIDQYFSGGGLHSVLFYPASSQGEATQKSVIAGIQALSQKGVKAIVVTRGGGSAADLRWFDDLQLCKAICNASVPVFAAIGHHDDVCVAEEVCFMRMKTPTAAAAYFVQKTDQLKTKVEQQEKDLKSAAKKTLDMYKQKLEGQKSFFAKYSVSVLALIQQRLQQMRENIIVFSRRTLDRHTQNLRQTRMHMAKLGLQSLQKKNMQLQKMRTTLAEVDPAPWLQKGWALLSVHPKSASSDTGTLNKLGHPPDIAKIKTGDRLRAHIAGGTLGLTVDEVSTHSIQEKGQKK